LTDAAVTITYASYTFAHGAAECTRFTLIGESGFKWAIAGDGFWWGAFTGNGATHGRGFVAAKIIHTTTVVGGVAGCSRETQVGAGLAYEKFAVGARWAILSIATISNKVCGYNAAGGERVTALTKSTIGVGLAGAVVGVVGVARGY
jgi:hypothetical protein